jgi:glycerol-3-phosphate acyltransferase PlsY
MLSVALIIVLSYFIGSIPGSVWVGRWLYDTDIRHYGSGNAGATNAFRVLGWKAGLLATGVDLGKGLFAAGIVATVRLDALPPGLGFWEAESVVRLVAGIAAIVGHMFPIWAGFKGGKGVNTAAGVLFAIQPVTMVITLGIFALVLLSSRYVSLASLSAAIAFPSTVAIRKYLFHVDSIDASILFFSILMALTIFLAHRSNILRLLDGNEARIRSFKPGVGSRRQST